MDNAQIVALVDRLRGEPAEVEWLEFKETQVQPATEFGEYLSALSNGAALARKPHGYLVLGVEDETHAVTGTRYNLHTATAKKQNLLFWTTRGLLPRVSLEVYEVDHPGGRVVLIEVGPAPGQPVKFYGTAYIRVSGSKTLLADHPQKEAALWHLNTDWSAEVVPGATLDDLDPAAIRKAREQYAEKNPRQAAEIETWDVATFLNKAKVTRQGRITRAALLLLGRPESSALLSPAVARMSWFLKDDDNHDLGYEHFDPPFILQVDLLLARVRNLTLRALPDGTLFPVEIQQYDPYVLREALHNAIAHQDYSLQGRIQVVETPSRLLITNVGSFLPGSVERVIRQDAPEEIYRNPFLAVAMVNLNMIDTQGGGIRRMFQRQRERYLPLPDYDLSDPERVRVTIPGKVLDEQYTRLLMERTDLDLWQILMLDRVQKGQPIPHDAHRQLRVAGLVEGRYPNSILAGPVARATGRPAAHIRQRGFDDGYYRKLILELVTEHGPVSRSDVDALLLDKLPESLTEKQKKNKVHYLLGKLRDAGKIRNRGSRGQPEWVVVKQEASGTHRERSPAEGR
jgi:ATP-dependent DNA helicase RecG